MTNNIVKNLVWGTVSAAACVFGTVGTAQAAIFYEKLQSNDLITEAQGSIGADIEQIKGNLSNGLDADLYQLQFNLDGHLSLQSVLEFYTFNEIDDPVPIYNTLPGPGLFLFDHLGHFLKFGGNSLDFDVVAGETFYLGISNLTALNTQGEVLFDPSKPNVIGNGTFGRWDREGRFTFEVVLPYSVSLSIQSQESPRTQATPEPSMIVGLTIIGLASLLKKKIRYLKR